MTTRSKILGCLGCGLAMVGGFAALAPLFSRSAPSGVYTKAISNGKQVFIALKLYASGNKSGFPDIHHPQLKSANEVFRELFKEDIISDERIFGAPGSVFSVDSNIGGAPAFAHALEPGECHWMLLKNQTDMECGKMDMERGKTPLLIENALNTSWPPRWDTSVPAPEGKRRKGQAWPNRTIIVIRSDGSVAFEELRPDGTLDWHSANNLDEHGKSWIDYLAPEQIAKLEYWDVEEKK